MLTLLFDLPKQRGHGSLDGDDRDQGLESRKILRVPRVECQLVGVSYGRDKQIGYAGSTRTHSRDNCRDHLAVAARSCGIEVERVVKAAAAERVGFEPTKACTLPAFQASAISQTRRPLLM